MNIEFVISTFGKAKKQRTGLASNQAEQCVAIIEQKIRIKDPNKRSQIKGKGIQIILDLKFSKSHHA